MTLTESHSASSRRPPRYTRPMHPVYHVSPLIQPQPSPPATSSTAMSTETSSDTLPSPTTSPGTPPPSRTRRKRSPSAESKSDAEAVGTIDDNENSALEDIPEPKKEYVEAANVEPNTEERPRTPHLDREEGTTTPTTASLKKSTRTPRACTITIDPETNITLLNAQRRHMLEDIDLYKRDIAGFKKDIEHRNVVIYTLQQHLTASNLEIDNLRASHARISEEFKLHKQNANAVVAKRDTEIARLEAVVSGLKMSISTNTRVEEAVGDEVFRDTWGRIGYDVMNWCLTNGAVKGGRVDLDKLDEDLREELVKAVPEHGSLIQEGHRVHVVQSLVAVALVREVFSGWFLGLRPEQDKVLRELEKDLEQTSTPAALTSWRSSTYVNLRNHLLSTPDSLANLTTRITTILLNLTTPLLPTPPTPAREKSLTSIVDSTIRIATQMRCQRATFRIVTVGAGVIWDPETMDDITGEEEEGSIVGCVTWPGIEKWGDEMGEWEEVGRCVVRGRVVCMMPEDE